MKPLTGGRMLTLFGFKASRARKVCKDWHRDRTRHAVHMGDLRSVNTLVVSMIRTPGKTFIFDTNCKSNVKSLVNHRSAMETLVVQTSNKCTGGHTARS